MADTLAQQRMDRLGRTVAELVEKAVHNERILRRYQQFELQMLAVSGFDALLECLLSQARQHFHLDAVELWLLDPEQTLQALVDADDVRDGLRWLTTPGPLETLYPEPRVRLVSPIPAEVFDRRPVKSAALLPLLRHGRLIGSFHFGSFQPQRFSDEKSTDFIDHLGSIIAMCLENAITQERWQRLSLVDALTQVANRRAFDRLLATEIARATRDGKPLTLMLADLDHFKRINDGHGHIAGDHVLRTVAAEVSATLRRTDHVCRYGGEEFALILPDCDERLARDVAERIRFRIAELIIQSDTGVALPITLSVGCASWLAPKETAAGVGAALLAAADRALYQAKQEGRNRVRLGALS